VVKPAKQITLIFLTEVLNKTYNILTCY